MTYTISRAEQVLQTQRQALNLRWYPHYHRRPAPGGSTTQTVWCGSTAGTMPLSTSPVLHPVGTDALGHARSKDLVHWEHLPVARRRRARRIKTAAFPARRWSMAIPALIYTGHKFHGDPGDEANLYQVQCLATSRDGIHFERRGWWSTPRRVCTTSVTRRSGVKETAGT